MPFRFSANGLREKAENESRKNHRSLNSELCILIQEAFRFLFNTLLLNAPIIHCVQIVSEIV
ncbi:Arc family DNA-binding protein [Halomonas sp. SH5A2]|uniref:Arc family DNA-binding protein n=1 Tax=Halomonas sp. SH5A2 TaxID=2749040 RepID=UPI001640C1CF|nr:Arc family DNA-binding protein [Halomonas sp. SH5A2]